MITHIGSSSGSVFDALWDAQIHEQLRELKRLVEAEEPVNTDTLHQIWNTIYRLSREYTLRVRYVLYRHVHSFVTGKLPLLDYTVLTAELEASPVLHNQERGDIHLLLYHLLETHPELAELFADNSEHHRRTARVLLPARRI